MIVVMAVITPTITTDDVNEYEEQLRSIAEFSEGVHLDFADGEFAPTKLLPISSAWRTDDVVVHAHVMHIDPLKVIDDIMHLEADLVILHAEAENLREALETLQENGTRTGVAILPETSVQELKDLDIDDLFDHVLVFGGNLGYQGGEADLSLLKKVTKLREDYPDMEISWDGGVNDVNVQQIVAAGVDVLNVGGYIRNAKDPKKAYDTLVNLIS